MRRLSLALTAVLACLFLVGCSSKDVLLRDISERDANEIVATLFMHQITSEKTADAKGKAFTVSVDQGELAKAVAILHAQGLPRDNRPSLNEVFKQSGFAPTPFEERVRFIYGVSQELERTIAYMPGVITVRVHIVVPEKVSRRQEAQVPSASVLINHDSKTALAIQVPNIRKLVAESVEGLNEDRVEVITVPMEVNLAQIKATPVTSVGGLKIHTKDMGVLSFLVGVVIVLIGAVLYLKRGMITTLMKKFRQ